MDENTNTNTNHIYIAPICRATKALDHNDLNDWNKQSHF